MTSSILVKSISSTRTSKKPPTCTWKKDLQHGNQMLCSLKSESGEVETDEASDPSIGHRIRQTRQGPSYKAMVPNKVFRQKTWEPCHKGHQEQKWRESAILAESISSKKSSKMPPICTSNSSSNKGFQMLCASKSTESEAIETDEASDVSFHRAPHPSTVEIR